MSKGFRRLIRSANGAQQPLSPSAEFVGVDCQVAEPLAQGIPVYAELLGGAELIATGFPQDFLEKRPLEGG